MGRDGREAAGADPRNACALGLDTPPRLRVVDTPRRAPPRPHAPGAQRRPALPPARARPGRSDGRSRPTRPSRSSPAAASTIASSPRSPRFRRRVSTFPRSGSIESSGSSARSCARRRTDAVPIRIPGASPSAPHSASRGSSRARKAATASPSTSVDVMSFAEWTATSMRPASSASSISFTKTPRAPISPNGFERSRSPAVVIGTSATSSSGFDGAQRVGGDLRLRQREPTPAAAEPKNQRSSRSKRWRTASA